MNSDNAATKGCAVIAAAFAGFVLMVMSCSVSDTKQGARDRDRLLDAMRDFRAIPDGATATCSDWLTVDGNNIRLSLDLVEAPDVMLWAASITEMGARNIVTHLMRKGINPRDEHIFVSCWAQRPMVERSPTGAAQVRIYGNSRYNPYTDQIVWDEYGD